MIEAAEKSQKAFIQFKIDLEEQARKYFEDVTFNEGKERLSPPEHLDLLFHMEAWELPLVAGGLMDQPALTLECLLTCRNARAEVQAVKRSQDEAMAQMDQHGSGRHSPTGGPPLFKWLQG
jgi:hypothetical protein